MVEGVLIFTKARATVDALIACRLPERHSFSHLHSHVISIHVISTIGEINCVVPGHAKARAVLDTLTKSIGTSCPATVLRRHAGTIVFLDPDSAKYIL